MRRNPIYTFKDVTQVGIDKVPLNSTILVQDSDGFGSPRTIQLIDKRYSDGTPFNSATTIQDVFDTPSAFVDQVEQREIPSELEKVTEGNLGSQKTGWRLLGEDPGNHGVIGQKAIDLTVVSGHVPGTSTYGALGNYSFSSGFKTHALGTASVAFGEETIAFDNHSVAIGKYNRGLAGNVFEIGGGVAGARKNIVEIDTNGVISLPWVEVSNIEARGDKALVTKEYSDAGIDAKFDKVGGDISGDVNIIGSLGTPGNLFVNGDVRVDGKGTFKSGVISGITQGTSYIQYEFDDPDWIQGDKPALVWESNGEQFYFKYPGLGTLQPIWYMNNQGVGTGLDADKLHGITGDLYATKEYVNNSLTAGLSDKYDKTGGVISGDVSVVGEFTANSGANLYGDVDLQNIVSNLNIDGDLLCDQNITSNSLITSRQYLKTGIFNGNSIVEFSDSNPNPFVPKIYWNNTMTEFQVESTEGIDKTLWHAGNFDPTTKVDVTSGSMDNLTVNNHLNVLGSADISSITSPITMEDTVSVNADLYTRVLYVGNNFQGSSELKFGDINNSNFEPTIKWNPVVNSFQIDTAGGNDQDIWYEGNFDPANKLSITGGTISGNLNVNSDFKVNGDSIFVGNMQLGYVTNAIAYFNGITSNDTIKAKKLKVGQTTSATSALEFTDPDEVDQPSIYWDKDAGSTNAGKFYVNLPGYAGLELYHEGNPPDTSGSCSCPDLVAVNTFESQGSSSFNRMPLVKLDVDLSGIRFQGNDTVPNPVVPIESSIYWSDSSQELLVDSVGYMRDGTGTRNYTGFGTYVLWHSGNLNQVDMFRKTEGGLINADVQIGDLNNIPASGVPNLYVAGDVTTDGEIIANGNITANAKFSGFGPSNFYNSLNVHSTFFVNNGVTISGDTTIGGIYSDKLKVNAADVNFSNLPTSDPGVAGQLWQDTSTGQLMISQ